MKNPDHRKNILNPAFREIGPLPLDRALHH
jgi:uncharacterized protein YkwD